MKILFLPKILILIVLFSCYLMETNAQTHSGSQLVSGPMLGYSTMSEVAVWLQTDGPATVNMTYFDKNEPELILSTEPVTTSAEGFYTAKLIAIVSEGKRYQYEILLNGIPLEFDYPLEFQSQTLWQYRFDAPDFNFVIGSCNYVNEPEVDRPGKPYGGEHFIFDNIYKEHPDFMVWMGDNTYLREVDWNSKTGIVHRYTHTRALPEMQPLLGSVHQYAIWDDHDYGPNNSDRSYWMKDFSLEVFKTFWANPNYGPGGGVSGTFFWNDAQFFLLDNRWFRTPNNLKTEDREFLGEQQLQWLIDALSGSEAPFKFVVVGGQVLNPVTTDWSENYAKYPEEQQKLFDAILRNDIKGVFFFSGDRHFSELSKMDREGTYPLYDLTVSTFTAGPTGDRSLNEANIYREEGTYYGQRNYALLNISGPKNERVLTIQLKNNKGELVWERSINENELK
ncbi:MAG: alkaline phosphatase family protein [Bacteroidales bacterium]|nr:alkaline phosphatase family protein [Bacteroidales bacterium]